METQTDPKKEQLLLQEAPKNEVQAKQTKAKSVGFFQLFRFATGADRFLIFLAIFFSSLQGALIPGSTLFFANVTDDFGKIPSKEKLRDSMVHQAFNMLYLGLGIFGSYTVALMLWMVVGQRQMKNLRNKYFQHLIRKNATWFDQEKTGKVASAYYEHLSTFTTVYSNKMHIVFQMFTMILFGFAVGFYKGWLVSLIILAASPLMSIGMVLLLHYNSKASQVEKESYSLAGSISDESFEYIRTVKSLNGQEYQIRKYSDSLAGVLAANNQFTWKISFCYALFNFCMSGFYALCFFFGNLVLNHQWFNDNTSKTYTSGDYLGIYFGILTGVSGFGVITPLQRSISEAKSTMSRINQIVNDDNQEDSGTQTPDPSQISGEIQFENVSFAYPSAADKVVLKNVSFTVRPGDKMAIVGPSGSGKSTIMQLIERFYEPTSGRILLDGMDIREIELGHYRRLLGMVSQQPVLFADTIASNLKIGIEDRDVSEGEIWDALERANIKDFVQNRLEEGLETYVGNQGSQLSGGQKQRLSIARTLLRNPQIFLFDEATSALDRQNERQIQETIDQVCTGVTSVNIAHRLLTVKNSDMIIVLCDGQIEDMGTHEQLMTRPTGTYFELYSKQVETFEEAGDESTGNNEQETDDNSSSDGEPLLRKESVNRDEPKQEASTRPLRLLGMLNYLKCSDIVLIVLGVLASTVVGVNMPFTGYFFGKMMGVLGKYDILNNHTVDPSKLPFTRAQLWDDGMNYIYVLVVIAGISFVFAFLQLWFFSFVSEKVVIRLRKALFRKFINKDVEFFDQPDHKPGNLSQRLAEDCRTIRIVVGQYMGSILQSLVSFGLGIGFGIYASWRISVLIICMSPLLFFGGILGSLFFHGKGFALQKEDENLVQEALNNIKVGPA